MTSVPTLPLRADVLLSNSIFMELDGGISEEFLRQYTGNDKLDETEFLELQVDAVSGSQRVECLGHLLPNLLQLRMNQSSIRSLRDLGTGLSRLRVLWLCRSSLQDLGGITSMPVLEELYVSFNDVRELSPLLTHEALHVLDLEGNLIEDFNEVKALKAVPTLREINLSLNPFLKSGNLSRAQVLNDLPQIEVLDDLPRDSTEEEVTQGALDLKELLNNGPAHLDCSSPLEWVAGAGVSGYLGSNLDGAGDQESRALQDLLRRAGRPIGAPPTPHHAPVAASTSVDNLAAAVTNDDLKAAPPRPPSARPSSAPQPPPEDVSGGRGERRSSGLKGRGGELGVPGRQWRE
jgi:hypothetical protein